VETGWLAVNVLNYDTRQLIVRDTSRRATILVHEEQRIDYSRTHALHK
jgi:hypothetical protein